MGAPLDELQEELRDLRTALQSIPPDVYTFPLWKLPEFKKQLSELIELKAENARLRAELESWQDHER